MRLKILVLLVIVCTSSAQAIKIKIQAGTIYSGTLVSANESFLYLSVNGSFIKILKSVISEIDDKPYPHAQTTLNNTSQPSQPPATTKANIQNVDTSAKNTTNDIIVHLKNGTSFTGALVSENERIVVLNINGSSVNIFRAIISEIEDPAKKNIVSPNSKNGLSSNTGTDSIRSSSTKTPQKEQSQLPDNSNKDKLTKLENTTVISSVTDTTVGSRVPVHSDSSETAISSTVLVNTNSAPVDSTVKNNSDKKSTTQGRHPEDTIVKSSKLPDTKGVLINDTTLKTPAKSNNVNAIVTADLNSQKNNDSTSEHKNNTPNVIDTLQKSNVGLIKNTDTLKFQNRASKDSTPASTNPVLVQKSISMPAVNTDATFAVSEKKSTKRTDGNIEIVLKNGASFIGKIISEDDRIVRFESDGVIINIIKQLIRDIDGVIFNKNSTMLQKDPLITKIEELNYKNTSANAIADTLPDLQRAFPKTSVPQGIKTSQLTDSLHSISWEQRSQTTRLLAATGMWGTEAIPELKKLLADTLMGSSYEPVWIDSSNVNQLLSPGDEAARALSRMGEPGFNALKTLLRDTSTLVRRRATFGLGELSTDPAWAALSEMLKDPDRGVRAVAVTGLRSTKFSDLIIIMLKDEDAEVRADAAFMLGKMRDRKAIRNLKTLLYDKRSFVRAQAADALCSIGGAEALRQLINASQDANLNVRENAAYALGETGDSIAVQPLISLLHDKMTSVRVAAISALSQIKDPRAIPSLYSMLKDEDPQIREAAEIALKKHTDIPTLIESLDNQKTTVKENVLYMLWLMTGQDIGMEKKLWQEWYTNSQVPLKIPLKK